MKKTIVKFGTSGWRAVMCDEFTFANVKVVTQAIADMLKAEGKTGDVLVGFDCRFMGSRFAKESCRVLAAAGLKARLTSRPTPTPVISFDTIQNKRAGAINFTASHNPPEYNGLKFSPDWGGPALPQTTKDIENRANALMADMTYAEKDFDQAISDGDVSVYDPRPAYLDKIRELVDFDLLRSAKLKIAIDPLYGTAVGYLDELLKEAGCELAVIHENPDPTFGGRPPEPSEENIPELIELVKKGGFTLGLSTDGDADRYGIVDVGGRFMEPNYFLALLFDYMVRDRGFEGGAARSVATSHLIDRTAQALGRPVYETAVGFKFIGELLTENKLAVGGEESAGLTIRGHVPEKDGILACLLAAEMVARRKKPLFQQLEELYAKVGTLVTKRLNFHLTATQEEQLPKRLAAIPQTIAGRSIAQVVTIDGTKLILDDGSWILVRKSGTEPVMRLYGEAPDSAKLKEILDAGATWLL